MRDGIAGVPILGTISAQKERVLQDELVEPQDEDDDAPEMSTWRMYAA